MSVSITFLRHSKTTKQLPGQTDNDRQLTPEGIALAVNRGKTMREFNLFDLGIVSDRVRTRETLMYVAEGAQDDLGGNFIVELPELFNAETPEDQKLLDGMYEKFGNKPIVEYYRLGTAEEVAALRRFAARGWALIVRTVRGNDARTALVVNHAIYAPAMLDSFYPGNPEISEKRWEECDGVTVVLDDDYNIAEVRPLPALAAAA